MKKKTRTVNSIDLNINLYLNIWVSKKRCNCSCLERICGFFDAPVCRPNTFLLSCIKNFEQKMYSDETTHVIKRRSLKQEFQALVCQRTFHKKYWKLLSRQLRFDGECPASNARGLSKIQVWQRGRTRPQFANLTRCPIDARMSQFSVKNPGCASPILREKLMTLLSSADWWAQTLHESRIFDATICIKRKGSGEQ
jgi:hypothetical protein